MPPEVAAKVTQRFYRADPSRARNRGGSGLGMSIADAAVSAHGGSIGVASVVGQGTTVTVTLPLA
jgi:two-component system OmpR family sensor kinase